MVSPDPSIIAAGLPQPPRASDTSSRKRTADEDNNSESTTTKKAALDARGPWKMRRSGTLASFHGSMRPSTFSQCASLSRSVSGEHEPLSQPTPTKFDIPAVQSAFIRGEVLSSASSSVSPLSSAPTSFTSFQLSNEVRHSLNHATTGRPDGTSPLPSQVSRPAAPRAPQPPSRFIPQFGPAHRSPPDSACDDQRSQNSHADSEDQPLAYAKSDSPSFGHRLRKAQEQSEAWNYIVDKLEFVTCTCKGDRERQALLKILGLPRKNDLDDKPMRETDRHQRRYNVIMGAILHVVGVVGHCDACSLHSRKNWEHREKTCIGLPPEASGPGYQELVDFVAGRCSNCIRSNYRPASCHFTAGDGGPVDFPQAEGFGIPHAAANHTSTSGSTPPQNRATSQRSKIPTRHNPPHPPPLVPTPQAEGPVAEKENDAEAIIRDAILVGFRASTQLQPQEQRGFHDWLMALLSFSSSSPGLEDQALAALARLRQLDPGVQVDIRRRILQMLPGAMGRSA
ncbi:hypothetical protein DHEL01_v205903 [Diaporthe helianthi]|uniref:Uncharacterized protein n=1 Tax=Diaporthe helianthi TaxID=158607 RepID=A0A2P5HZM9_DIAHE|nr:hypothetical protein DHEL01_v205903 [Diaporthe helianthi]